MSNYSIARDYIATRIALVANTGTIHTHERLLTEPQKFLEAFAHTISNQKTIRGFVITLESIGADLSIFNSEERAYTFNVYGIMGVQDSADTEETFYDLIEAVMDALDGSAAVMGIVGEVVSSRGPAVARNLGYRQFGSTFCHYGEIVFSVQVDQ